MYNVKINDGYEILGMALQMAADRCQIGKGAIRHGSSGADFAAQPMFSIRREVGPGFTVGQALKKISEAGNIEGDARVNELLDAIIYLASEVIAYVGEEHGKNRSRGAGPVLQPTDQEVVVEDPPKRKRGRPRKQQVV